ncbi:MAG: DUF5723 family protein [bacterium]|nr:DUF5723 family protein [bacterium]
MQSKRIIYFLLLGCFSTKNYSQDYFSYGSSNYGGINQVLCNPAAAADNRLKADLLIIGGDNNFNNSWFYIKRESLKYSGSFMKPSTLKFADSWHNPTPNVPSNIYKNFSTIASDKTRAVLLENRIYLPSFLIQLNSKNSFAFTWSLRQIGNIDGVSPQLVNLFQNEFDLSLTQNHPFSLTNFSAVQMSWIQYGFTYGRVLRDKDQHFFKAGITPKLLQGIEASYVVVNNLDYLFSTKDTTSYLNANFAYGHSGNFSSPTTSNRPVAELMRNATTPFLGLDLGIIYEWRPNYRNYTYKVEGKKGVWRKDLNKYKLKFGVSVVDIGKIRFKKQGNYNDLNITVSKDNVTKFTSLKDQAALDSLLRSDFSNPNQESSFAVILPTAINTQIDFSFNRFFYLNLSAHIADLYKSTAYRVHNYSAICFAPRFEHYLFEISVPFTYNKLSADRSKYLSTGLNLRAGPISIGSNDMVPLFKGDVASYNFYVLIKFTIPQNQIRDRDADGVPDKKDACPDEPGFHNLKGCPDKDEDNIIDMEDACPNQAGLAQFKGCPDTDEDSITDAEDLCPTEKGKPFLHGCPDSDGDSIADKDDACPITSGLRIFKGCPDSDKDGTPDKEDLCPLVKGPVNYRGCPDQDNDKVHDGVDACPTLAGPAENKGCPWPDQDKDGIIDKLDSCINTPGVTTYKGCPEPIKLAQAEKKILEKAFATLEFETGKDIIKTKSLPSLTALAKLVNAHKQEWKLKLSGHTDNEGTGSANLILSQKRVKAVQTYLRKKGVPAENILIEWFGQSKPIADNGTKAGKQKNRRVEMTVLQKIN